MMTNVKAASRTVLNVLQLTNVCPVLPTLTSVKIVPNVCLSVTDHAWSVPFQVEELNSVRSVQLDMTLSIKNVLLMLTVIITKIAKVVLSSMC